MVIYIYIFTFYSLLWSSSTLLLSCPHTTANLPSLPPPTPYMVIWLCHWQPLHKSSLKGVFCFLLHDSRTNKHCIPFSPRAPLILSQLCCAISRLGEIGVSAQRPLLFSLGSVIFSGVWIFLALCCHVNWLSCRLRRWVFPGKAQQRLFFICLCQKWEPLNVGHKKMFQH